MSNVRRPRPLPWAITLASRRVDVALNEGKKGCDREAGYVLLAFPYGDGSACEIRTNVHPDTALDALRHAESVMANRRVDALFRQGKISAEHFDWWLRTISGV